MVPCLTEKDNPIEGNLNHSFADAPILPDYAIHSLSNQLNTFCPFYHIATIYKFISLISKNSADPKVFCINYSACLTTVKAALCDHFGPHKK